LAEQSLGIDLFQIRNTSVVFGDDVINDFCKRLNLDLIVRAHEVKQSGYEFKANNKLCTVFSAPNYAGTDGNIGAVMLVSKELEISFLTFEPELGDYENGDEYEEDPDERTPRLVL
jgi:protein phosphatase